MWIHTTVSFFKIFSFFHLCVLKYLVFSKKQKKKSLCVVIILVMWYEAIAFSYNIPMDVTSCHIKF